MPLLIHIPSKPVMNFKTLWVIIFWVRVTHKMLNVNWEKIHSIILSVTCHGLRNFAPAHTHPLKTSREFSKPYKLLFSELESLVKCNHKIRVQECYGGFNFRRCYHNKLAFVKPPPPHTHTKLKKKRMVNWNKGTTSDPRILYPIKDV